MKKLSIVFSVFIAVLFFQLILCPNKVRAEDEDDKVHSLSEVFVQADGFMQKGGSEAKEIEDRLKPAHFTIFKTLFAIGVALTVIVGGILGIKFMIASAEDKAQIKEMMIPYVVGCIVIYGAFGIWSVVVNFLDKIG